MSTSKCVPFSGYFDNLTAVSVKCPLACLTCSSITVCSSCSTSYFLRPDHSCQSSCEDGYFPDNSTNICQNCPSNCSRCSSSLSCSACNANYYLTQDKCPMDCPLRYFPNITSRNCDRCPYDCLTCGNNLTYISCSPEDLRVFNSTTGRCQPMAGYFDDGVNALCFKCPSVCEACTSATVCTKCEYHNYLGRNGSCLYKCPQVLLEAGQERPTCPNCRYDCLTCDAYGDCLTCNIS